LVERATEAGYPALSASVEKNHPEVAIFEHRGFEHVGETEYAVVLRRALAPSP
jgi:hypothetical protein